MRLWIALLLGALLALGIMSQGGAIAGPNGDIWAGPGGTPWIEAGPHDTWDV